jgi:DNA mismatch repair protein MutS2
MDDHGLDLLELPAIRVRVGEACCFSGGTALAREMRPAPAPEDVSRRIAEVEEALALMEHGVSGPRGAHDVRPLLPGATRGAALEPQELHDVHTTLEVALELREALVGAQERAPGHAEAARTIQHGPLAGLAAELERSIGPDGALLDTASPALAQVRRRLRAARAEAERLVGELARRYGEHLQERFTTRRAGRPVLAVKSAARRQVPGLVHDRSASGETVFVEPLEVVEQNNLAAELAAEERAEEQRILAELSGRVAQLAPQIEVAVEALAALDFALARAAVSQRWNGCRVGAGERVVLRRARHPLIAEGEVVPVEIDLGELRALVISGPNTGGKTVALKTLGLFAALHQCGMRVPAESAELPVFDQLLVDIGDEQSIEQSLSTFSGHVARLRQVVEAAGERSLALLDEVASGTDPVEGAALAQAVLEFLTRRGTRTIATTHHAELKEWAAEHEGAANAAVGVDPETLRPTYELRVGEPGASHAFSVAARLGLPRAIIDRAGELVSPTRRAVERVLEDAESARAQAKDELERAVDERRAAADERTRAERRAEDLERRIARSGREAEEERTRAREQVEAELAQATAALAELRREIAAARKLERERRSARPAGEGERDRRLGRADAALAESRAAMEQARRTAPPATVAVGDRVIDSALGVRGTVEEIENDVAVLSAGAGRVRVPLARLRTDAAPAPPPPVAPPPAPRDARPAKLTGTNELDLRGRRADEAQALVREHVDTAMLSGIARVRVIHGKGTGALRRAVREEVQRHPLVERVETAPPSEGGDGATLVYLEDPDRA